ncbi:MAG: guanylate kinase [Oligoflexia bacterium]|nr:guanylate kinase [Oligoflexia bacterium]
MKAFRHGRILKFEGESRLKPCLIIVSAPSGAGKSTLCARLVEEYPEIIENVSFTTRPPRNKEDDGVDYFFVDMAEFEEKKNRSFFVEHAMVHDHCYGVSFAQIETAIKSGRPIILDIDVQGAKTLLNKFPDALTIFVLPPSIEELERRLKSRDQGKTNNYMLRIKNAASEMAQAVHFKHQLINENLEEAYAQFKKVVETALRNS